MYEISRPFLYGCWGALALVWVLAGMSGAARRKATEAREGRDEASKLAGGLAILVLLIPDSALRPLELHTLGLRVAGIVLLLCGAAATIAARVALGRMWSSAAIVQRGHHPLTKGPYAITRHPIYSGTLLTLVGSACVDGFGRWLPLLLIAGVALARKAVIEERLLLREFPRQYAAYRREVPPLVPSLRLWRRRRS